MKGRNGSTSFLPLKKKGGFQGKIQSESCLTKEQAKQVYDKIESGEEVMIRKTMQQSTTKLPKQAKARKDVNQYEKTLMSDRNMVKSNSQMEQWSILSNNIVYVKLEDNEIMNGIDRKLIDYRDHKRMYRKMGKEEGEQLNINFGESLEIIRNKYMDMYDEIYAEVVMTSKFDENVDLSITYLGKIDMKREEVMKVEVSYPISEKGFVMGKLLNGEECQILLDMEASKSYMSKSYYLRCKALHNLPKFTSKTQRIQGGNGQYAGVFFVIPVIVEINGHRLEAFTLVSEMFDNIDMVLGIKNLFKLEGVIDSRESSFRFLSRSTPIFPREQVVVKPVEKKLIPIETLFLEEISGMAIIKIIDQGQKTLMMLKLKFIRNKATSDIANNRETVIFDKKTSIGILDLRLLGYYKIKQGVLQKNLNKYYQFEDIDKVCAEFNKMVEAIRQEEKNDSDKRYPGLDNTDERKYMTDKGILDKYIDLKGSCLDEAERKQVMKILYEYKDVFSLRDEIGTCPNIEVNIEVTDNLPFFIRPYYVKEEDRTVLDKEMRRLCYLGILKEGFVAYSSPVMLISQKLTSEKRVVTDFRHLNMRIVKNNLAYPLLRDTFALLGSSKCEVMSVLDLKDVFHSLWLSEKSQKYCGILPYFGSASYLYQRMPMGLNVSPPIWQMYINAILNSLQSRKYCEAIMDDLLLFKPSKGVHMDKLEDLLKALRKNGLKISPKKCQLFKRELQYMGNTIFIKERRVCIKPLCSRLEVIQKIKAPATAKQCKSFAGMVNFLSIFCPDLQKLLKPIYDLTRKARQFVWGKEQQDTFEEIKHSL